MSPGLGGFRDRARQFFADVGLGETGKALRDGRPLPPEPPHNYRTCRDEYCPEELCRVYREGLEDGREEAGP